MGAPFDLPEAEQARAIYMRRQLDQAAEHGAAMLDALDLSPVALDALDAAIATLDDLDGDPEAEDDGTAEAEPDDEDGNDAEHSLGAPERCPWSPPMGARYYKPAAGQRLQRCFVTRAWNQVAWAAGANVDGEGEPEAGYDLPEGDNELCGSGHDGCEPEEKEDSLGSPAGDGNQRHWAQGDGGDVELVNEDGEEGGGRFPATARPVSARRLEAFGHYEHRGTMRAMARQAVAMKRRVSSLPPVPYDPDLVTPIGVGMAWWRGPTLCNVVAVALPLERGR